MLVLFLIHAAVFWMGFFVWSMAEFDLVKVKEKSCLIFKRITVVLFASLMAHASMLMIIRALVSSI